MAFFKLRWPGHQEQAEKSSKRSRTAQTESIEIMRRRARHRLMGAAILVVIGVVVFPMLFDTQPRPILVDIPIHIPDRQTVAALAVAPTLSAQDSRPSSSPANNDAKDGLAEGEEVVVDSPARVNNVDVVNSRLASEVVRPSTEPLPPTTVAPTSKPAVTASVVAQTPTPTDPKAQRNAVTSSSSSISSSTATSDERFIVQVGAFAENEKARDVRLKLEKAGIKTYTQVVETKDGKRIRVRVGPLANRVDAEKAAARIKSLNLPAAVLTL